MNFDLKRKRIDTFPEAKLFAEMERIWRQLGHRPSRNEWDASSPRVSYNTIRYRFGGWVQACVRFIEYKMGGSLADPLPSKSLHLTPEEKRTIPLGVRLKVLQRDNFACVLCGRSPAIHLGLSLHIDHKIPFSHGGKITEANLQTLCSDCNLGKGSTTTLPNNT